MDLSKRFGCLAGGVGDIKTHAWFKATDWMAMLGKDLEAPIRLQIFTISKHRHQFSCAMSGKGVSQAGD